MLTDSHQLILLYLSTGPLGSYYAELRSGGMLVRISFQDEDFHSICSEWTFIELPLGRRQP
jgi:hypothetical protein